MPHRLGFDIGGTFTDLFLVDEETGEVRQEKVSSTPDDPSKGALRGIEKLCSNSGINSGDIERVSHGTTTATNALLEREGATTALLTTEGFRDPTAIGREKRTDLYNYSPEKPAAFTAREYRFGVPERLAADGTVLEPLDEDRVHEIAERIREEPVESVAVSLLHAYRNDDHERRVREILKAETRLPVSTSTEVMAEIKEYERTLSTVINAYVAPVTEVYIRTLKAGLDDLGFENTLYLMQSSGGVVTPEHISKNGLRLINSGPAAGVLGAKAFATESGFENIITLDIGGTSADAGLVRDGIVETTTEGEIDDISLLFPQIDVRTIGAGGGSVAWLDRADVLKVGPKSAGATPGPACYGRGGERPTVTDAALVLGYIDPEFFLGGEMELDLGAAKATIESLADRVETDAAELADGILDIASTNVAQAVRLVTVEKGYDPRNFMLTCFGGAGPMLSMRVARKLGVTDVVVPAAPGVLSAAGLVGADERFDFSKSHPLELTVGNTDEIRGIFEELRSDARTQVGEETTLRFERTVDIRYRGQTFQLEVTVPGEEVSDETVRATVEEFTEQYEAIYGHVYEDKDLEAVTWRLQAIRPTDEVKVHAPTDAGSLEEARKGNRTVFSGDQESTYAVYDRYQLPSNISFDGPAIVEEDESTTVVDAKSSVTVDDAGNLLVSLE